MVFSKLPNLSDAQALALPFIVMPYLIWAFMDDMWAVAVEAAMAPLTFPSSVEPSLEEA